MKGRLLGIGLGAAAGITAVVLVSPAVGLPGSGDNIGTPTEHRDAPLVRPAQNDENTGSKAPAKPGPLNLVPPDHENGG